MKKIVLYTCLLLAIFLSSCNEDVVSPDAWKQCSYCQQLIGTSWRKYSEVIYLKDGSQYTGFDVLSSYVHTFTNKEKNDEDLVEHKHRFVLEVYDIKNHETSYGDWYIADETEINAWCAPSFYGQIIKLTSDELVVRKNYENVGVNGDWDYEIIKFKRVDLDDIEINTGSSNQGTSGQGTSGNSSNSSDNVSDKNNPYSTNYIHFRWNQRTNYYHEIKFAKQEIEFASYETIHGWNYKYLNFYIGYREYKVGFQFESCYYEDEYPSTSRWPAMQYNITSASASAITHFPIARMIIYDDNMNRRAIVTTTGKGEIKYVGNTLLFNFTSDDSDIDNYVDIKFEGTLKN